jgi:hypothetical protein
MESSTDAGTPDMLKIAVTSATNLDHKQTGQTVSTRALVRPSSTENRKIRAKLSHAMATHANVQRPVKGQKAKGKKATERLRGE